MNTTLIPVVALHSLAAWRFAEAVLRQLTQSLRQRLEARRRRRDMRLTLAALGALDDRALHDLGLSRSELHSVAANPGDDTRSRISAP